MNPSSESEPDPGAVDALFGQLLELPAAERPAALADAPVEEAIRSQVRRLLELADDLPPELDAPVVSSEFVEAGAAPRSVGPYAIQDVVGVGGMGVVYRAQQERPRREVALKLMRASVDTPEGVRRFEHEAEVLGRLQHPGIAQIFEFGTAQLDTGPAAFIAMELVDGVPLTEYARAQDLDLRDSAALMADIAEAVHHAHLRGVIHRDLKPNNVLVTPEGRVKVIDFGVARAMDSDLGATRATLAGELVGTLAYMSPEQVRGDADGIDARTDVYGLGVLAYQLLSGQLPHDLEGTTLAKAAEVIVEHDVRRLGVVAPACRGDLEWIVGCALEKESHRRYQSAHAMAEDLRRWLAHETVEARPASATYQLRRLARRHRAAVLGMAATLLALLGGGLVSLYYALENRDLAQLEANARRDAEDSADQAREESRRANAAAEESRRLTELTREQLRDLERVSGLQTAQLEGIDIRELGTAIGEELRTLVRQGLERRAAPEAEVQEVLGRLDGTLQGISLTTLATRTLQRGLLDRMGQAIEDQFAERPELRSELLRMHSTVLMRVGAPVEALEASRSAYETLAVHLGAEHPDTLRALVIHAGALNEVLEYEEAYELLEEHRGTIDAVHGPGSEPAIQALRQLAMTAGRLSRFDEAADLFGQEADRLEQHGGGTEEAENLRQNARVNQASSLVAGGRGEEAEEELRELLASDVSERRRVSVLVSLGQIALLDQRGDEAVALLEDALELAREVEGADQLSNATICFMLGDALRLTEQLEAAAEAVEEAHRLHVLNLGPAHDRSVFASFRWATALLDAGELVRADEVCTAALTGAVDLYGAQHVRTNGIRATLLRILEARAEVEWSADVEARLRELGSVPGDD
ncbi:MAG: serine/threonine-protein kinase [Planctomycetota bacterium]